MADSLQTAGTRIVIEREAPPDLARQIQRVRKLAAPARLAIGLGMIPRGEVGLIFAGIGTSLMLQGQPVLPQAVFSAIVLMVLVTTLLAPVGLRWAFRRSGTVPSGPAQHGERDESRTAGEVAKP
jgi:hypothetical protein